MFRQHRQQVSVVVLQRQQRQLPVLVQGRRPLAGAVAGMAVAGQGRGVQLVARQPTQGCVLQPLGCGGGAEVPQVGAEQAVARQAQGQGPFAVGTEGQGTGRCRWCRQGQGGQAAAQPQHQRPLGRPAHHAVVTGVDDRQAVAEHRIGQLGQDGSIAEGIPGDRLTAAIGAGGHQHPTALLEQQLLQTTGGPHHPQPGAGARHGCIDGGRAATAQQQDRRHLGLPQLLFGGLGVAMPGHPGRARQQGQGLIGAALSRPDPRHRLVILRPCQQLKAPHRLHGHHGSAVEGRGRRRDRLSVAVLLAVPVQPWPALGATDGLGMEAAVGRIAVFPPAAAAGGKGGQAGVVALKRELLQQAVAGPAVGAADERVAVAVVVGIGELGQAGPADG